jgi:hypothetical protein
VDSTSFSSRALSASREENWEAKASKEEMTARKSWRNEKR